MNNYIFVKNIVLIKSSNYWISCHNFSSDTTVDDNLSVKGRFLKTLGDLENQDINTSEINGIGISNFSIVERLSDKRLYIFTEFLLEYGHISVKNYKQVLTLVNTSTVLQRWLKDVNASFKLLNQTPDWVISDPVIENEWKLQYESIIQTFKFELSKLQTERDELQVKYNKDIGVIDTKQSVLEHTLHESNPALLINRISVQALPFEITAKYLDLSHKSRRNALKNELVLFKQKLFKDFKSGNITTQELLDLVSKV